jgi:predicted transcriptional regulator YheO
MSERRIADELAERLLDEPNADPDDDLRTLSRQLLRCREVVEQLNKELAARCNKDGTLDLVNANRDTVLRIHEDGLRRIKKQCEYLATSLMQSNSPPPIVVMDLLKHIRIVLKVVEAVNTFHPMYDESWSGWPEGS